MKDIQFKKTLTGEVTLKEIDGLSLTLVPSIEDRTDALQIVSDSVQLVDGKPKTKNDIKRNVNALTEVIARSYPSQNKEDIREYVVKNVFKLWTEYLIAIDVYSKEKAEDHKLKAQEEERIEQLKK